MRKPYSVPPYKKNFFSFTLFRAIDKYAILIWMSPKEGNSIYPFSVKNIPDKRAKRFMRGYRKRDAHQKERRCASKKIPLPNRKNSLGQEKKFSWAREIFPLGKRIVPISPNFAKWHRRIVSFLAASFQTHSLKKGKCSCPGSLNWIFDGKHGF